MTRARRTFSTEFKSQMVQPLHVLVSDLTYVRVAEKWNYICLFVDLFNREMMGYSAGANKDHQLVMRALASFQQTCKKSLFFTQIVAKRIR
ncbi:hypothetical protein KQI21_09630 [Virgibacillus proomii]|nr:hypothetical protein [Virgibacillus proomii]